MIEGAVRLLPREEPKASTVIEGVFAREGIDTRAGALVTRATADPAGARLTLAARGALVAERLLVAVGRAPATDGLGLDSVGVRLTPTGHVHTDERLATSAAGIYAAGDVAGLLPFTHAAFAMGRIAAGNALGRRRQPYRTEATPRVTFTEPEVAGVGLTEAEAATRGGRVAHLPMSEMDRAIAAGETDGFVQLIAGPRRRSATPAADASSAPPSSLRGPAR